MNKIFKFLKSPFPFAENLYRKWGIILGVGFFVWLFLKIFQPFGLYDLEMTHKDLFFIGYGVLSSLVLFIMFYVFPKLFPAAFSERNWTLGKHLLWLMVMLFLIGMGNFIYSCSIGIFICSSRTFLLFQFYTLVIGLFPVVGLTVLTLQALKSRYTSEADDISRQNFMKNTEASPEREIILSSASVSEEDLVFQMSELYGIASDGNYIRVFLKSKERPEQNIMRKTLKETEDELAEVDEILRVHRSYLVNLGEVKRVTGNAQGLILHFDNSDISIPVSRKYISDFRSKYNQL
jgi:hypothetical protein